MHTDDRAGWYDPRDHRATFQRLASSAFDYLRSRSSEHWLLFCAGLVVGLMLG